jgi:tetratricopeptide (TPR) repeat protein
LQLFVAMPYGSRSAILDYTVPNAVPVEINFDDVWHGLIEPALPDGWHAFRADEIGRPGLIDQVYIEHLLEADLVLADITFGNPNVYYELGIRQALSPRGTLLIAHRGTYKPFDLRNQTIEEYVYVGGVTTDGPKFVARLRTALVAAAEDSRSPVYLFLPGLFVAKYDQGENPDTIIRGLEDQLGDLKAQLNAERSDARQRDLADRIRNATSAQRLVAMVPDLRDVSPASASLFEAMAIQLRRFDRVELASKILQEAVVAHRNSSALMRELGFCYRVLGRFEEALSWFEKARELSPNDPELLGMMGGLYKRAGSFDKAKEMYERAISVDREDLYPLLALCGLLVLLRDEVSAVTHYGAVLSLTTRTFQSGHPDHWTHFARGEAFLATEDLQTAADEFMRGLEFHPPPADVRSELEQLRALQRSGWRTIATGHAIQILELAEEAPRDLTRDSRN